MADKFWSGEKLEDLLTMSPKDLAKKYEITESYATTQKSRVIKRIKKRMARMEKDPGYVPSGEHLEEIERVREFLGDAQGAGLPVNPDMAADVEDYRIWTQHSVDRETGEPIQAVNRYIKMKPKQPDAEEVYESVTPVDIRPTRRARQRRLGQWLMAYGDMQIEYRRVWDPDTNEDELMAVHDEHALDILYQIHADYMPEVVVDLGDPTDLAALSRFDASHDNWHRTISPSLQRTHNHFAQLKSDNPDGRRILVDSNHSARVHKSIMKNNPAMYGLVLPNERYPLFNLHRLAKLDEAGVETISGYGAATYVHGEEYDAPPIRFKHGTHSSSNAGATVRKEAAENPDSHIVRGHGHSFEQIARTTRDGWQLRYMQLGATCLTGGQVEGYHSAVDDFGHPVEYQENWQKQILMIQDYGDGHYEFHVVDIRNGVGYFNGVRYESRYIDEKETPRLAKNLES